MTEHRSAEVAAVKSTLDNLIEPLRGQIANLDKVIAEKRDELAELEETRKSAAKTLAYLDPSSVPVKVKKDSKHPNYGIAADTLAAFEKRLHDKADEVNGNGGFTATSLRRDFGFDDISQSTISKMLSVLHNRDLIRLDHRGRGGAHFYKVVA